MPRLRPRPRLRLEAGEGELRTLGPEELGELGVGREGALEEDRRGFEGGLGVLCAVTEALD